MDVSIDLNCMNSYSTIFKSRLKPTLACVLILSFLVFTLSCGSALPQKVLVFTKTAGYYHASIPSGVAALRLMGEQNGFEVDTTSEASWFTHETLSAYNSVVFLSTTGDVLDSAQQAAFERFIQNGGGFVGIHAAADTEYDWPWYNQLVGAYFLSHPHQQEASLQVVDNKHAATKDLPQPWLHFDEWYNYKSIASGLNVLLNLDETSYEGGENGANHPIAWYREFDGGRMFYTGLGHTEQAYTDPIFLKHLLGGIEYVLK